MSEQDLNKKIHELRKELEQIKSQSSLKSGSENLELIDKNVLIHELQVHQIELEMQNQMLQESQNQLAISNEHYKKLFDLSPGGLVIVDNSGMIQRVNSTLLDMLNIREENIINTAFASLISPTDRSIFNSRFRAFFKIPGDKDMILRLNRKHGGTIFAKITGATLEEDTKNKNGRLQLSITDITSQKEIENRLKDERNFSELLVNTISSGIFTVDEKQIITSWNKSAEQITGFNAGEMIGKPCILHKNCEQNCFFNKADTPTAEADKELYFKTKNGKEIIISRSARYLKNADEEIIAGVEIFKDITEQRASEKALEESRVFAEAVAESTPAMIYIYDMEKQANIWANNAHKNFFGSLFAETVDIEYRTLENYMHPEDFRKLNELTDKLVNDRKDTKIEMELRFKKDDGWVYMNHHVSPFLRDKKGKATRIIGALFDISEQKKIEEALASALSEHESIFNSSLVGIMMLKNRVITRVNNEMGRMLGYSQEEMIGGGTDKLHLSMENFNEFGEKYYWRLANREIINVTYPLRHKNGNTIWCHFNGKAIAPPDLEKGAVWIILDITDRKNYEEKIQKLLSEKELILKEVHHRIKNNMATIESLLNLQAMQLIDPISKSAIKDAIGRVASMRVLYEKLFRSDNFNNTDIKDYLSSLIDEIISVFPDKKIKFIKNIDNFTIDARLIFPLGIIINELITNIMKYAFTGENKNLVGITAEKQGDYAEISIQDNGKGFPEGFRIEDSSSFGLQLVQMLTEQLKGKLEIESAEGTKIYLKFKAF